MAILTKSPNSKLPKSYTIEPDVNDYVEATKGDRSASKRVNELLKRAIIQEQYEQLEREAALFFATETGDRSETKSLQRAPRRTLARACCLPPPPAPPAAPRATSPARPTTARPPSPRSAVSTVTRPRPE